LSEDPERPRSSGPSEPDQPDQPDRLDRSAGADGTRRRRHRRESARRRRAKTEGDARPGAEQEVAAPSAPADAEPAATAHVTAASEPVDEPGEAAVLTAEGASPERESQPPGRRRAPIDAAERGRRGLYETLWSTGLPTVGAIAHRELGAFFVSPIGYVVAAVLVLPVSFLGYVARVDQGLPVTMDPIFGLIALLMVFFTPLYTMRLLAEERRAGTLEVLLTSPVRDWEVVVGKWLGGFLFYLATIAFTLVYVVLLSVFTQTHYPASILGLHVEVPTVDYGRILAGYVGVALVGAAWVALGLFASSLTSNQIIAAVVGVGLLLAFQYMFGTLATFLVSPYSDFFDYLNAANHAGSFSAGRLVPKDALYFLTVTVGALFLTTRVLESRKWR
jgi:ABC-2 type transport system permease protein